MLLGPYTWGFCPIPRQRGLFVKSPLWNPEKQRLTFIVWFFIVCSQGIKRPAYMPPTRLRLQAAISCIHGAPPQTPPKGTFCKKSPLESRKTTFDFYCLGFTDRSQGIKRPAYMPPAFDGLYFLRMYPKLSALIFDGL